MTDTTVTIPDIPVMCAIGDKFGPDRSHRRKEG
jgi:hypothetical protein